MQSITPRCPTVHLPLGRPLTFNPNDLGAFFGLVLERTLEADRASECRLSGWDAIALECDRNVCFVAGQLIATGTDINLDALRSELCCWLDERSDGASSAAPHAPA